MKTSLLLSLFLCGCTIAPHGSHALHKIRTYQGRKDGLVRYEVFTDHSAGGGGQLFTFTQLNNLAVTHTNSLMHLGGTLTIGNAYIGVDTNTASTITAIGGAVGDVVGTALKAAAKP